MCNLPACTRFSRPLNATERASIRRIAHYPFKLERRWLKKQGLPPAAIGYEIMQYRKFWIERLILRGQASIFVADGISTLWRVRALTDPNYEAFCYYLIGYNLPYYPEASTATLQIDWIGTRHWLFNAN
jgi:hypothetical protein